MPRIKLAMPGQTLCSETVPVRITDINYGNHLGNGAVVNILHEARMQWLYRHGHSELDIGGIGLIMADLAVEFKAEGLYGDVVNVALACADVGRVGFDLYYQLTVLRSGTPVVLALAKTGMVGFDYSAKKVAPLNEAIRSLLHIAS